MKIKDDSAQTSVVKSPSRRYILVKEFNLKVVVPASTSNLGPGFDTLGLAVNRYMVIESDPADSLHIEVSGEGSAGIPKDENNLVVVAMKKILGEVPRLSIRIDNGIPECGGFGASGAAIIGGLLLANEMSGKKFADTDIYNLAIELEGHPDNVSAALYGGMIVNARNGDGKYSHIKIDIGEKLKFAVLLPDNKIETETARKLLPSSITLKEAVTNVQHSSLLVAAISTGNYELIRYAVRDEIHEKHRKKLIPHFELFNKVALEGGALAFTISGAGSACIAFCTDHCEGVVDAFAGMIRGMNLNWRAEMMEPVNKGAEVASGKFKTVGLGGGK